MGADRHHRGQNQQLRLTTNVTNLPLRPPFVLAKTVASLDLLSRGRIELGLGAGAFWDAVAAAGGPRRTPKEAVAALAEGIEIIRATWDTSQRSVRLDGEHYRAAGVHPGPAPAHDVEIWIGAIGPKMLALTGRMGDGWLPSQAYVPPEQLAEKNRRIDDAALAAGREPAQIRRLYNVNPSADPAWAESLAELAVGHGVSTFIVAGDDPRVVQEFGTEIAPAVRELVARERATAGGADEPAGSTRATTPPTSGGRSRIDLNRPSRSPSAPPGPTRERAPAHPRRRRPPQRPPTLGCLDPPDVRLDASRWPGPRTSGPPAST